MTRSRLEKYRVGIQVINLFLVLISPACFSQTGKDALALSTVLKRVNDCYPQILIARLEVTKAQGDYLSALGKFDPNLNMKTRSQPAGGYINNYTDNQINIPTLANGLKFFGGYRIGRGDWPVYYQNYLTNSGGEYRAGLTLPLLKDRLIDKERAKLLTQAEKIEMNNQEVGATKIKIYQEAIRAYWQWVQAGKQLTIFKQLLNLAQERQKAIIKQASEGDLARLAIAENRQFIIQRQQLVNQGQMIFEQAAVNLSIYYRDENNQPKYPMERQLPADLTSGSRSRQEYTTLEDQIRKHPIFCKLEKYYRIIKLKQNLAKNDLLPNLEATAYTFKQNGSGGDPLLIPQAAMVGLRFTFPLLQREAKGKLITATTELQQIATEKKFIFDKLKNELTNLLISKKMYQKQVNLLTEELALAKQVQAGETEKFYQGDSTLFLVNQREQASTQVQLNLINSQVNLQQTRDLIRFFSSTNL
ncbi:TolC family protein [Legionella feeleii]|uniref:Multidrug efflux protein, outer membrane component n=1 Tax=Legionella feeleii TaxID=453 RepID=A0A0W0TMB7_9GAMM|nr:TolC family protein [Legionella feeleii]KTC96721.1 multidrug efflux protein, outer membrane component [Legionella feeleii]SPX60608.1 multidrug efflux protein, outer membrane component [Legionella feeleii]